MLKTENHLKSFALLMIITMFTVFLFTYTVSAQEEKEHPFVDADSVSGSKLEQKRDKYLEENNYTLGVSEINPGNGYLGWAESSIKASSGDIKFGQSRMAAFDEAFMKAKGEYIRTKHSEITSERIYEFVDDDMPEPKEEKNWAGNMQERLKVALEKAVALGEAKLDQLLEQYDIDPDKFASADTAEKQAMLETSIRRETITEAYGSVSGLVVERTFEDTDSVGVLVRYSSKTQEIARQINSEDPVSLAPNYNPGLEIENHLKPLNGEQLAYIHGIRIMKDENGENTIVAFGQWSPAITKNDSERKQELEIESAKKTARSQAEAALADFVNATAVLRDVNKYVEREELYEKVYSDGRVEEGRDYNLGQYVEQTVEQHAEVELTGITTVDTWTANHPVTKHLLVGHIIKWSPTTKSTVEDNFTEKKEETTNEEKEEEDEDSEVIKSPF